jgi:hypothetical protein
MSSPFDQTLPMVIPSSSELLVPGQQEMENANTTNWLQSKQQNWICLEFWTQASTDLFYHHGHFTRTPKNKEISPAREMYAVTDADMTIPKRRRAARLELFLWMWNNNWCAQRSGYAMQIIPNAWHKLSVSFVLISWMCCMFCIMYICQLKQSQFGWNELGFLLLFMSPWRPTQFSHKCLEWKYTLLF